MILIPMVGASSRFFKAGYTLPKYQLPLWGKNVFHYVMLSFEKKFDKEKFVFVIRDSYDAENFIRNEIEALSIKDYKIIVLDELTSGQAETVYKALLDIEADDSLTIFNIDTIRYDFVYPDFIDSCNGYLEVFKGEGEHWSFVKTVNDNSLDVIQTAEKNRISDLCSNGLYYFDSIDAYKYYFKEMLSNSDQVNGELYVAPMYNYAIRNNAKIKRFLVSKNEIDFCGTPDEYEFLVTRGPR
ncbi:capsular biosynthesis protein [Cobetia marina]|uniref:glycosyltransferase family 2 protein n=1 Tax=Cobetia marina TaxID=28258 RepID=UPI0010ADB76C|nr:glycosyltransferase family 2 protein [Cobetia marina]TKD61471.1 capsular biosynthesis protein [Cobetia marina]